MSECLEKEKVEQHASGLVCFWVPSPQASFNDTCERKYRQRYISEKAEFQGSREGRGRNQCSLPRQLSGLECNS